MIYRLLIICLFIFENMLCVFGQDVQIAGFVYDRQTGNPIADCYVGFFAKDVERQTVTDKHGFFIYILNKNLSKSDSLIQVNHLNYVSKRIQIVENDTMLIYLDPHYREIEEVTIYSAYKGTNKGSEYTYTPMEALSTISVVGEPDVIRHISSMPGVSQGMEGTLGLFVRGGNNGSNSILFNQVPIYATSHLGMFSTFPPEVISESSFYLGGTPTEYGNFSSSLITIHAKRHYGKPLQGQFSISPYLTGGYLSLPLKKEKISVQVSGRTSLLPFILNQFAKPNDTDNEQLKAQLLDFTALVDWKINEKNYLNLMFYTNNDFFDYRIDDSQNKLNWGSNALKLGWNSQLTSKIKSNVAIYFTTSFSRQEQRYFKSSESDQLRSILRLGSGINEFSAAINFSYQTTDKMNIKAGLQYQSKEYEPLSEKTMIQDDSMVDYENKFGNQSGHLSSSYMEIKYTLPQAITASVGFRNSIWNINEVNSWDFDFHALTDIYISEQWGAELTYDRFVQYYHVLEGLPVGWSHNVVTPADDQLPQEITDQLFAGIYWKYPSEISINATVGGFYRKMKNLVSYINSSNLFGFTNANWKDEVDTGTGDSFGMELSASIKEKRIGATVAYTLSKSDRKFTAINDGEKFPFKFDRRHIVNLQTKYTVVKGVTRKDKKREQYVNGVISYSTGNRATLPIGSYEGTTPPFWEQRGDGWRVPYKMDDNAYNRQIMSGKNEFKMKDYFRIDIAYTFVRYGKRTNNEFAMSVFNVLNRKNPFLYYHDDRDWYQLSIFPVMPTFRWCISF